MGETIERALSVDSDVSSECPDFPAVGGAAFFDDLGQWPYPRESRQEAPLDASLPPNEPNIGDVLKWYLNNAPEGPLDDTQVDALKKKTPSNLLNMVSQIVEPGDDIRPSRFRLNKEHSNTPDTQQPEKHKASSPAAAGCFGGMFTFKKMMFRKHAAVAPEPTDIAANKTGFLAKLRQKTGSLLR